MGDSDDAKGDQSRSGYDGTKNKRTMPAFRRYSPTEWMSLSVVTVLVVITLLMWLED
ncbi:hypothetical protein F5X96DRAFT_675548 [Biscogniauxia mediterranea]|nr:hypothetical protein F5X96DRAFT_675548 [Biscogniauxia mediterranea]